VHRQQPHPGSDRECSERNEHEHARGTTGRDRRGYGGIHEGPHATGEQKTFLFDFTFFMQLSAKRYQFALRN